VPSECKNCISGILRTVGITHRAALTPLLSVCLAVAMHMRYSSGKL
jgi:hypothetical protein